jgi:hypothetical protein
LNPSGTRIVAAASSAGNGASVSSSTPCDRWLGPINTAKQTTPTRQRPNPDNFANRIDPMRLTLNLLQVRTTHAAYHHPSESSPIFNAID